MTTIRRRIRALAASVLAVVLAVGALMAVGTTVPAQAAGPEAATTWLPPAYLLWRTGGLPPALAPKLDGLSGVERVAVVTGDTLWMSRSVRADGTVVDSPPKPYRIPLEVMAVNVGALLPFLPGAWRATVADALRRGEAVVGTTSAKLRRLGVDDRVVLRGGDRISVGAVVPDAVAAWSELMVAGSVGRPMGVRHPRFALLQMHGRPSQATLARRIARVLGPGYPPRVRAPGKAQFRRQGDAVWPPVLMKAGFGEFSAYPDPRRPGYLRMNPAFVRRHLASRRVPLLGRFTCHERVFPALIEAMARLRRQGHARAIKNFAGCYNARMVLRMPSGAISHHSWGAAVDINSIANPYGAPPHQPAPLVNAMRANGFSWGGRWTVPDAMHFEFVAVPGLP